MAGFISERVAGFILECLAGFVGIRTLGTMNTAASSASLRLRTRGKVDLQLGGATLMSDPRVSKLSPSSSMAERAFAVTAGNRLSVREFSESTTAQGGTLNVQEGFRTPQEGV
jgi:hypothetical protein